MIDQRFEEAAKRGATKMLEEFGRLAMEEMGSSAEAPPISNRWPEYVDRVLQHATTMHFAQSPPEDASLDMERGEQLTDGPYCRMDTFVADPSFEIDAATSPGSPTSSLSEPLCSSSRYPDIFPMFGLDQRAQQHVSGRLSEPKLFSLPRPSNTSTERASASYAASDRMTNASLDYRDPESLPRFPSASITEIEDSASSSPYHVDDFASPSTYHSVTLANDEGIDDLRRSRRSTRIDSTGGYCIIGTLRAGKNRPTRIALQQKKRKTTERGQRTTGFIGQGSKSRASHVDRSDRPLRIQEFVDNFGSATSLMNLRSILLGPHHTQASCREGQSGRTAAEIFRVMDCRDEMIQLNTLQQSLDAVELYERLRLETSGQSSERFQLLTSENFDRPASHGDGNPLSLDKAEVIARLVREAAPDIVEGSCEYTRKRVKAKEFRACGGRLASIAERFGKGMIPLALTYRAGEQRVTCWRRHIIFDMTQSEFRIMLDRVDVQYGDYLRKLSSKLEYVLDFIRNPTPLESGIPLEHLRREDLSSNERDDALLDAL